MEALKPTISHKKHETKHENCIKPCHFSVPKNMTEAPSVPAVTKGPEARIIVSLTKSRRWWPFKHRFWLFWMYIHIYIYINVDCMVEIYWKFEINYPINSYKFQTATAIVFGSSFRFQLAKTKHWNVMQFQGFCSEKMTIEHHTNIRNHAWVLHPKLVASCCYHGHQHQLQHKWSTISNNNK